MPFLPTPSVVFPRSRVTLSSALPPLLAAWTLVMAILKSLTLTVLSSRRVSSSLLSMVLAAAWALGDSAVFCAVAAAFLLALLSAASAFFTFRFITHSAFSRLRSASGVSLGLKFLAERFLKGTSFQAASALSSSAPRPVLVAALALSLKLFCFCQAALVI